MTIKFGVLGLLSRRNMYGYELKEELQAEIGSHYVINFGSLYRVLEHLNKNGYVKYEIVSQERYPDKKVYCLTAKGEKYFLDWLITPISGGNILKNDFYIKLVLSFTSSINPKEIIDRQRQADTSLIQALIKLKRSADPKLQIRWILLLEMTIFQTEARIKWLELCRQHLQGISLADKKQVQKEVITKLWKEQLIKEPVKKGGVKC